MRSKKFPGVARRVRRALVGYGLAVAGAWIASAAHAQESPSRNAARLADIARRSPLAAATLEAARETPAQKLATVMRLLDLGEREAASLVLPEVLSLELDDAERAALVSHFGSAKFIRLIRQSSDQEDETSLAGLKEFAQSCFDAATTIASDPTVIDRLVTRAISTDEQERLTAKSDLKTTGAAGVAALLSKLASTKDQTERSRLLETLAALQPTVEAPLLAALTDGSGQFRRDVVELAGYLQIRSAVPLLAALAAGPTDEAVGEAARRALRQFGISALPTPPEAETLIRQSIDDSLAGILPKAVARDADVFAAWNNEARQLQSLEIDPEAANILNAARLSRAFDDLGGAANLENRRLAVMLSWEEAAILDLPSRSEISQASQQLTPTELNEILDQAVDADLFAAAIQAANALGALQDLSALVSLDAAPTPLVDALESQDRDLKFAALSAIMAINPPTTFPGSSRVVEALWYFASSAGKTRAVVASPIISQATSWAGQVRGIGFEADVATTGRDAIAKATNIGGSSRLAVIVIDDRIANPSLREALYQLRANRLTAGVPVIVFSGSRRLAAHHALAESDALTLIEPRPHGEGVMATLVDRALERTRTLVPPVERRVEQAGQAIRWLKQLHDARGPYDELMRHADILETAVFTESLTDPTIDMLASFGSPKNQRTLAELASSSALSLDSRRQAADAFKQNVERYGLQLGREDVLEQYRRYNASETASSEVQSILGQLLDAIETASAL